MSTCRICGNTTGRLIKYSVRHYAHPDCALTKWGGDFFNRLTPWQAASQFPISYAHRHGVEKELRDRAALYDEKRGY